MVNGYWLISVNFRLRFWQNSILAKIILPGDWRRFAGRRGSAPRRSQHLERLLARRRRKGAVERRQLGGGKRDIERRRVLAHMLLPPRLGDDGDAVLMEEPGKSELRRADTTPRGKARQRRMAQHAPLLDGRIGHDRHLTLAAPGQQVPFGAAPREII